jgi:hypothetical protein
MPFLAIWAHPNGPKKVPKSLQVNRMYAPTSKLKNKLLTKSLGPLSYKKRFETIKKRFFMLFLSILGQFGYPQIN